MHSHCLTISNSIQHTQIRSRYQNLLVHSAVAALEDGGSAEVTGDLAADVVVEEVAARAVTVVDIGFAAALGDVGVDFTGGGDVKEEQEGEDVGEEHGFS